MRDDLGILIQLGIISSPARLTDESLARMALYPQSVGAFVAEQSTQETVSTQDAGAKRSSETRGQSKGHGPTEAVGEQKQGRRPL
jgi:hypothetical protein